MRPLPPRHARALDVIGLGESSIDEVWVVNGDAGGLPFGGKRRAARRDRLGGGQIATALVACARLGLRAAYAGAVGDDDDGRAVLAGLRAEGVAADAVQVFAGGATRSALILVDAESGERAVIEHVDARVALSPAALPLAHLGAARVVHLDATDLPSAIAAARAARAAGAWVSLDVDHPRPGLDELLALADVCIAAAGLPERLTGESDLERALRRLGAQVPGLVGCTLGPAGAAALDAGHLVLSPAFPVADVVDTTGCGDTFRAGLLCALCDGHSVGEALRFANACAALKCRDLGRRGCPTKAEVAAFLAAA